MTTRLTKEKVRAIRAEYAGGKVRQKTLAWKYRVTPANICLIVNRRTWKDVK